MARTRRDETDIADLIVELGRKYIWWAPVGGAAHSAEHTVAQAMNLGKDIRRLELALGPERLVEIMVAAEQEFWRGRLTHQTGRPLPAEPPRRAFRDAPAL